MADVTPQIAGGVLIGLAAALLILVNGRVAGISGIFGMVLDGGVGERFWRTAFLAGLVLPALWLITSGATVTMEGGWPLYAVAGALVGAGTRLGSGCTSGHGVCGIANLSPRSLVATLTFMLMGMLTVWLVRHGGLA
ncbi:YeeE/YedE family protein [Fluviicoccus keumensis]|uniref:YeeE/YedE family protein n=1 Tax=Fluviicoccus keumensis TaxID=1435465 RepID=UPI003BF8981D